LGDQYVDVTTINDNFSSNWWNSGPLHSAQNRFDWLSLRPGTIHYARVNTWAGGWLTSDTIVFTTIACTGNFTAPTDPQTSMVTGNSARFTWQRGSGNQWFCVDTALTEADLVGFKGTWWAHGCGTTTTSLDVTGLGCGQQHVWRVYAQGAFVGGHSSIGTFTTAACNFTPPTNAQATVLSKTSLRFTWDKGTDNNYYCADWALSQADLLGLNNSWRNGCAGSPPIDATSLACGTQYFWRIWTLGTQTTAYTEVQTTTTAAC
jgi:hypothetical protein